MKKNTKFKLLIATLSCIFLIGCKSHLSTTQTFISYETECLGIELDGSQTLRAWGEGRNKSDAIEQAKKNAMRDVIFKGITAGKKDCNMRPIITEVNGHEKYEEYFNIFFTDGGAYKKYISMADEKKRSRKAEYNNIGTKYGITVRVLRAELKNRLKSDGIIK
ncbi:MAG: hypothetical protein RR280_06715 [Bacteroidaceae bacterium]